MPKWIHDRAKSLQREMEETYPPKKAKQVAFAVATQQAYAAGKAPKKWQGKPFGTVQGRREAKQKFNRPPSTYAKTATSHDLSSCATLEDMQWGSNALARLFQPESGSERMSKQGSRSEVYRKEKLSMPQSTREARMTEARSVMEEILGVPNTAKKAQWEGLMGDMNAAPVTVMDPRLVNTAVGGVTTPGVVGAPGEMLPAPVPVVPTAAVGPTPLPAPQPTAAKTGSAWPQKLALSLDDLKSIASDPRVIGGAGGLAVGGLGSALATRGMKNRRRRAAIIAGSALAGGGAGVGVGHFLRSPRFKRWASKNAAATPSAAGPAGMNVPMTPGVAPTVTPPAPMVSRGSVTPAPTTPTAGVQDFQALLADVQERAFQEAKAKHAQESSSGPLYPYMRRVDEYRDRALPLFPAAAGLIGGHLAGGQALRVLGERARSAVRTGKGLPWYAKELKSGVKVKLPIRAATRIAAPLTGLLAVKALFGRGRSSAERMYETPKYGQLGDFVASHPLATAIGGAALGGLAPWAVNRLSKQLGHKFDPGVMSVPGAVAGGLVGYYAAKRGQNRRIQEALRKEREQREQENLYREMMAQQSPFGY